jgi:hypothetical protein
VSTSSRKLCDAPGLPAAQLAAIRSIRNFTGTFTAGPVSYRDGINEMPSQCDWIVGIKPDGTAEPASDKELCSDTYF